MMITPGRKSASRIRAVIVYGVDGVSSGVLTMMALVGCDGCDGGYQFLSLH